jgi:hypothetical protein
MGHPPRVITAILPWNARGPTTYCRSTSSDRSANAAKFTAEVEVVLPGEELLTDSSLSLLDRVLIDEERIVPIERPGVEERELHVLPAPWQGGSSGPATSIADLPA